MIKFIKKFIEENPKRAEGALFSAIFFAVLGGVIFFLVQLYHALLHTGGFECH